MTRIPLLPGNNIWEFLHYIVTFWLVLSLILAVYSILRMYYVEIIANDTKFGKARIDVLKSLGRFKQLPLYSMEEMAANRKLEDVRLSVFMKDSDETGKFVIILPGGGYAHCCTVEEGYPTAAYFNEMGYTAFILEYRTGLKCTPYGPMEDLAKALDFIEEHKNEFNVSMEGFAVVGYSAGGNLASIYASETHDFGYKALGGKRPGCLILGYPWTNVSHWAFHPYWNPWIGLLGIWLSERGFFHMFGFRHIKNKRKSLCAQYYINENYPPTFIMAGGLDTLVPASRHADVLVDALEANNVSNVYKRFFRLPHGIGIGRNTSAAKWINDATAFWEETVSEK